MKKRILKTLKAYLQTNKDVLSQEEIKDIKEQIKAVENYKPIFKSLFGRKYWWSDDSIWKWRNELWVI